VPRGIEAAVQHQETKPSAAAKGEGPCSKEGSIFAGCSANEANEATEATEGTEATENGGSRSKKRPALVARNAMDPAWYLQDISFQKDT
jgi:hypothetical protein